MANCYTYNFPVQYKLVPGCTGQALLSGDRDDELIHYGLKVKSVPVSSPVVENLVSTGDVSEGVGTITP